MVKPEEINQLLQDIEFLRVECRLDREQLNEKLAKKAKLEVSLIDALKSMSVKTWKNTDGVSATIAERKGIRITDEKQVIGWLKANGKEDAVVEAIDPSFKQFSLPKVAKTNNIPGVEEHVTEYLSVRSPKENDNNDESATS